MDWRSDVIPGTLPEWQPTGLVGRRGVGDIVTARFATQRKEEASQVYQLISLAFKDMEMY